MDNVKKVLNKKVANFEVLYIKLHHHWFVKGNLFYTCMKNLKSFMTR